MSGEVEMVNVLIIEDDMEIAALEKDYLEINACQVSVEDNGKAGLKRALAEDYNIVLTEIDLPDMSGFEICRNLRKEKDIPIIIISRKKDEVDKIRGLGIGADDYIVKPFNPNEMVARVKANLSCYKRLTSKYPEMKRIISYPGLEIDMTARRVYIHNEEKLFTTKEFDLLSFLASHPNKVFSKDELFSAVWGMDSLGDIATVTVHIKKIRHKIGQTSSKSGCIETVWGSGYRFRVNDEE